MLGFQNLNFTFAGLPLVLRIVVNLSIIMASYFPARIIRHLLTGAS